MYCCVPAQPLLLVLTYLPVALLCWLPHEYTKHSGFEDGSNCSHYHHHHNKTAASHPGYHSRGRAEQNTLLPQPHPSLTNWMYVFESQTGFNTLCTVYAEYWADHHNNILVSCVESCVEQINQRVHRFDSGEGSGADRSWTNWATKSTVFLATCKYLSFDDNNYEFYIVTCVML